MSDLATEFLHMLDGIINDDDLENVKLKELKGFLYHFQEFMGKTMSLDEEGQEMTEEYIKTQIL